MSKPGTISGVVVAKNDGKPIVAAVSDPALATQLAACRETLRLESADRQRLLSLVTRIARADEGTAPINFLGLIGGLIMEAKGLAQEMGRAR